MIIAKLSATAALLSVVVVFASAAITKRRGDWWDKIFNAAIFTGMTAVVCVFISLIWGL